MVPEYLDEHIFIFILVNTRQHRRIFGCASVLNAGRAGSWPHEVVDAQLVTGKPNTALETPIYMKNSNIYKIYNHNIIMVWLTITEAIMRRIKKKQKSLCLIYNTTPLPFSIRLSSSSLLFDR